MDANRKRSGFTLIEMLTVIVIMMVVVALALPNFIAMMKGRKWTAAVNNVQVMISRARALATNIRTDMSVEFSCQGDNGTTMWLESESNLIETMPPWSQFATNIQAGNYSSPSTWRFIRTIWAPSAGFSGNDAPSAGQKSPDDPSIAAISDYYDQTRWPPKTMMAGIDGNIYYGDNAKQSEVESIGNGITIDNSGAWSPNFASWDAPRNGFPFGKDTCPDVRIGRHGALVQSIEPTICLKECGLQQRLQLNVVRCTGRLVRTK